MDNHLPAIAGVIPAQQWGVLVTPRGLLFQKEMSEAEYALLMSCLLDIADFSVHYNPMFIGDALNYGERRWRETYVQYAEATKIRIDLLRDYKWVSGRCPIEIRLNGLTYNHYKVIAPLPTLQERAQWAKAAATHGWTTDELRRLVRQRRLETPEGEACLPPAEKEAEALLLAPPPHVIPPQQWREWCELLAKHVLHQRLNEASALAVHILNKIREETHYWSTVKVHKKE